MAEGYPEWAVNIAVIKTILGISTLPIPDSDLESDAILIPIFMQLDYLCPDWKDTTDEGEQSVYQIIVANLVGSSLLASQPKVANTRLGDSYIAFNGTVDPNVFEDRALALLSQVCPNKRERPSSMVVAFQIAPGGRADRGCGCSSRGRGGIW